MFCQNVAILLKLEYLFIQCHSSRFDTGPVSALMSFPGFFLNPQLIQLSLHLLHAGLVG